MAVLSQPDIRKEIEAGRIVFDPPLEERQFGEASVDLRLGFSFTCLNQMPDVRVSIAHGLQGLPEGVWTTKTLREFDELNKREVFTLDPDDFVLAFTHEKISIPNHLIEFLEGRSTYARVGVSMHVTAPWIQPGWDRTPVILEIRNHGGLRVDLTPLIDRPCQLSFFKLSHPVPAGMAYGSKPTDAYQGQEHPLKQKPKVSIPRPAPKRQHKVKPQKPNRRRKSRR